MFFLWNNELFVCLLGALEWRRGLVAARCAYDLILPLCLLQQGAARGGGSPALSCAIVGYTLVVCVRVYLWVGACFKALEDVRILATYQFV